MKAATAKKGGKKKKWSKGKSRDKLNNAILFEKVSASFFSSSNQLWNARY